MAWHMMGKSGVVALFAVMLAGCSAIPLPSLPSLPSLPIIGRPSAPSAPIADRRIDLAGNCSQTEEDGFREQAVLTIEDNRVNTLQWELWVGGLRADQAPPEHRAARAQRQRLHADGVAGPAPRHAGARPLRSALHARHL
jgi:hypothetical protein